jgi:hypothetical protein
MNPQDTITIKKSTYNELIRDQRILSSLYQSGVDNWEYYDEAMKCADIPVEHEETEEEIYGS